MSKAERHSAVGTQRLVACQSMKPDSASPDSVIATILAEAYGVGLARLERMTTGADPDAVLYQVAADSGRRYFLKSRLGPVPPAALSLPRYLAAQGFDFVIAPLPTRHDALAVEVSPAATLILYPFVVGMDAYRVALSGAQWRAFGQAVRKLHDLRLPADLAAQIPGETYGPRWREEVRTILVESRRGPALSANDKATESRARLFQVLRENEPALFALLSWAEQLAAGLRADPPPTVVCHTDLHPGNLYLAGARLYLVDWDAPLFAPRERDLMFPGGGQGFLGTSAAAEERLFFSGYGQTVVNQAALAYYRCERIIEDVAVICREIIMSTNWSAASERSLGFLQANFEPEGTLAAARLAVAKAGLETGAG